MPPTDAEILMGLGNVCIITIGIVFVVFAIFVVFSSGNRVHQRGVDQREATYLESME